MANTITHEVNTRNAIAALINTRLGTSAVAKVYVDSTRAALIATIPLNTTNVFGDPSAGVMALNAIPAPAACTGNGTPTWVDFCNSTGTVIFSGSVGSSGAMLNLTFAGPYSVGDGMTIATGGTYTATP